MLKKFVGANQLVGVITNGTGKNPANRDGYMALNIGANDVANSVNTEVFIWLMMAALLAGSL
jgi:hypothetical protein